MVRSREGGVCIGREDNKVFLKFFLRNIEFEVSVGQSVAMLAKKLDIQI